MTQRVKIENLREGGPYTLQVVVTDGAVPEFAVNVVERQILAPGGSMEVTLYGARTVHVREID